MRGRGEGRRPHLKQEKEGGERGDATETSKLSPLEACAAARLPIGSHRTGRRRLCVRFCGPQHRMACICAKRQENKHKHKMKKNKQSSSR